jgi:superfamily II DNA or RNA helicase
MNSIISYKSYQIPISSININDLNDLNVSPFQKEDGYGKKPKIFKLFSKDKFFYYLPREWAITKFGEAKEIKFNENTIINIDFKGKLRDYQIDIQKQIDERFKKGYGGGILCIPPGGGKTVCAINAITKLKVKTLIVVHKTFLLDQWVERLRQYTNASIGVIKQDKFDVENRDVVIGMLQTIISRKYDDELNIFDMVIFDEAHHLGAEVFSKVMQRTQAPYLLGLTATPEREDKLEKVFYYYLGDIIYRSNKIKYTNALINVHYFKSDDEKFKKEIIKFNQKINLSKMITNLTEIKERNDFIFNIIKNILDKEPNRKIFILTNRRNHIEELKNLLQNYDVGLYIGGMKKKDLALSEEKAIIIGTYEMASEGLDIPDLDTLIMTTPKSNITQSIGRIMRKELYDNIPLIVDIVDKIDIFYAMYNKRKKIYQENKYEIKVINKLDDSNVDININIDLDQDIDDENQDENQDKNSDFKEAINYKTKYMFDN